MRATALFVSATLMALVYQAKTITTPAFAAEPNSASVAANLDDAAPDAVPLDAARVEEEAFAVWLEGPSEVAVGKASTAQARVHAKEPYKCNDQYPAKFTWDAHDGASVASPKVKGMKVEGKDGTLALTFTADRPGPVTLSGTLSFSVCTKTNCRVEKRKLQLSTKAVP